LITDLKKQVDEIRAEQKGPKGGSGGGTRALIVASNADKAFCAGADLRERRGMSEQE
jgi:methylglutaconyl-CoA hydratase